ncbi:cell elongation protein CozEa [Virgibacillus siamensis]|uniref:Cell elongation protein CozEa n=2 Tax=Virgibacillus siamensis TaxID=480071 RepID=A0ABN1G7R5_9BACI
MMQHKRWFQTLVTFILIFLLILLISATDFIFDPLFKYVGAVAIPLIGAGVLYYLTRPVMHLLEKYKINRIISIIIVFLLLILFGYLAVTYIAPIAQKQVSKLIENIPEMVDGVQELIIYWQANQENIPEEVNKTINNITANLQTYIESAMSFIFGFVGELISFVFAIVLIPFFLFFMLKDGDKFVPFVTQIFEKKKADNFRELLHKIDETLTSYIQGQLIVSLCIGVLLYIGYSIIDLDYALTLALFAMLVNVIPFVGPFLAVIPALIVGAFQDPMNLVWIGIIMLVAQQLEGNLVSPNVMGRALRLHPLTVITIILAAGSIAGFLGILFAVPFYAIVKTVIVHVYQTYYKKNGDDVLI